MPDSTWARGTPTSTAARAPGEGRGGIAVDEHPVGPLGRDRVEDPRLHRGDHLLVRQPADAEAVGGLRELELLEENLRQLGVVVLPGVERDLVDSPLPEGDREGRRLDELGAVSHHGQRFHGRYSTPRLGPLAQLVEQGTLNPKVEGSNPSRPMTTPAAKPVPHG